MRYKFFILPLLFSLLYGSPVGHHNHGERTGLVERADPNYGDLSVPTAAEPLDQWATTIYAKTDTSKEVFIDFDTVFQYRPTARFEVFSDRAFYMTLTGLYGCTSVVVTSYCGAYISHFWQAVMDDAAYKSDPNLFIAAAEDALKGIQNKAAEADANKNKQFPAALIPDARFISLEQHKTCLSKDMGAKAFVFTPGSLRDARVAASPNTVAALQAVVAELTGLTAADIAIHMYKAATLSEAKAKTNGKGKVLLTYSPDTKATGEEHAYQVHVSKSDDPGTTMALGDTWTGSAYKCTTCVSSPLKVKNHESSCCIM